MKQVILPKDFQWNGANYTDLFIIGATRGAAGANDFTAAALSQVYNLMQVSDAAGVCTAAIQYPLCLEFCRITPVGTTGALVDLGVAASGTGSTSLIIGVANDMDTAKKVRVPLTAAAPIATQTASQFLTARVTTVGNVNLLTAGEFWIFVCAPRMNEINARYE